MNVKTALLYAFFALVATGVNLLTQWPFFAWIIEPWNLYAALFAGTLTGLVTKYALDKRWIFYYTAANRRDDLMRFVLYSLMGVMTTAVFWGTEIAFFYLFDFPGAHYAGGAIGLSVGYTVKYLLDRRYVFKGDDGRRTMGDGKSKGDDGRRTMGDGKT